MPISSMKSSAVKKGFGLDAVLDGWEKQGIPDSELLQRGMKLIEALYSSASTT